MKRKILKEIVRIVSDSGKNGISEHDLVKQAEKQLNLSRNNVVARLGKLLYDGIIEVRETDHTKVIKLRENTEKLENFTETKE